MMTRTQTLSIPKVVGGMIHLYRHRVGCCDNQGSVIVAMILLIIRNCYDSTLPLLFITYSTIKFKSQFRSPASATHSLPWASHGRCGHQLVFASQDHPWGLPLSSQRLAELEIETPPELRGPSESWIMKIFLSGLGLAKPSA